MLARKHCPDVKSYASDRVFDGVRPLSADRVAKLRANYQRTHTTTVFQIRRAKGNEPSQRRDSSRKWAIMTRQRMGRAVLSPA